MRTTARKRTSTAKPRTRQRSLFDKSEMKINPKWKQPRHSKADDPGWVFAFIDPAQLGVEVTIPQWMLKRGQGGRTA